MTPEPAPVSAVALLSVDVDVRDGDWSSVAANAADFCSHILLAVWARMAPDERLYEVSVVLADDVMLQQLNNQYRGKEAPTNVLSFSSDLANDEIIPDGEPRPLGDIILSWDTLSREASDLKIEMRDHFTHLLVHGMLHLLGFDHENDEDATEMETCEVEILSDMGIANPYLLDDTLLRG